MAIDQGRVIALGKKDELAEAYTPRHRLDFGNVFIYPGFIDPHCHFMDYGYLLQEANLYGSGSWGEAVSRLVAHQQRSPQPWVKGRGWDQNLWKMQEFPDKTLLDKAFPHTPVIMRRVDSHAAMVNEKALSLAGIDVNTQVEGGLAVKRDGKLTGLLLDNAISLVSKVIPLPNEYTKRKAIREAEKACFGVGLTSVSNAGTKTEDVELFQRMQAEDAMTIRIYVMMEASGTNLGLFAPQGPIVTDRMSIRSFKLYADGALGSRGAHLLEPYADDPESCGLQTLDPAELRRVCGIAKAHGFQVNVHAIGDAAVRMVLDVYEEFLEPCNDLRWRIEHAQIVQPDDIPRFGRLSVIPSIQTTHATSDMKWVSARLGPARMMRAYPYRALLEQNGWLPNGSDFPIERIEPLRGFCSAVTKKNDEGEPEGGFQPENALTRDEALKAMTIWAARANFEEDSRGSLTPGKWADFTVLDTDLMSASEEALRQSKVIATASAGTLVHQQ
ncbi:MAG: amidohydrolase [Spirochaetaceae bacterium]|nr:amidohydrolase [Spirochaetaceae bacterium]